ncbi:LysR family transcriptional regulator [Paenibacillus sonchi]|uniref:LysR family transcriptional regulator n=1 Tax=Paenibacillus sonchi TaxID=373687 RepID=A0A974P915_9BACL|nr:LysR family transcriptional regulator [Paenibacillus sonchi]QQZ58972.1 LysR family transcriptional regulator [Paenibacillus sonchi]
MVDFEWYRSFISIYKHRSVSEAAKTRLMTQPAMSQHLAALEAELGEKLFTRTTRKMVPTEKGKELYTQVVPLIEALEETTQKFKMDTSLTIPMVKIGTAHEYFRENLAPHLGKFPFRINATFGIASDILELLIEEKLDMIIMSKKMPAPGIEYIHYVQEEFVLVAPYHFKEIDIEDTERFEAWLCSQDWISYGSDLPIIRRFWREHFKKRPHMQIKHVLPDLHSILTAIEHGEGISALPSYMLEKSLHNQHVKIIYPSFRVSNELYLAYHIKFRNFPMIKSVSEALKKNICNSHDKM